MYMFLLSVGIIFVVIVINMLLFMMVVYVIVCYKFKGCNLLYSVVFFMFIMLIVGILFV